MINHSLTVCRRVRRLAECRRCGPWNQSSHQLQDKVAAVDVDDPSRSHMRADDHVTIASRPDTAGSVSTNA